ncbi:PREDICTED: excitatory amino acid transporter 3-like [Poecilia mexicana]|uniref:excitatory amino acid transporter 3-like n=1 Tax=Poecilia mexicana TaxID=48701 RepID=UPI00072D97E4|nr:PREDICTED: excitatory amino acid transporter 3-like [Poecilia mexicana]
MTESLLQAFCMLGVALGIGAGFLLRALVPLTQLLKEWIEVPGKMLLQMLQMFGLPLIVTSVLAGVTGLNTRMSRKTAIITGSFICGSTLMVIILGMFLALTIKPGVTKNEEDLRNTDSKEESTFILHVIMQDLIRNMVPENFFQAFFEQYKTEIVHDDSKLDWLHHICVLFFCCSFFVQNGTQTKLVGKYVDGPNMLGLIIWSFVIGIMLNVIGQQARITVEAIQCLNDAVKVIVNWILWYLPVGVLFLIIHHVLDVRDWGAVIKLTKFVGVVCAGEAVQAFVLFPVLYLILTRRNPFLIFKHISRALTTAFIIASSAATLPLTLQCCEENVKVDKKLCRLILSSAIVTFGSAGIPQTGAVTTILILTAVGLPAEDAAILVGVEWILDHFITVVNVLVNVFGVAITNHVWHDDLITLDKIPSDDRIRSIKEIELDLSFLDSDEEFIPSVSSSASESNSPRRGDLLSIVTPTS